MTNAEKSTLPSSFLRTQERALRRYIEEELRLRTRFAELPTLEAMVVGPGYGSATGSLVLADDLAPARRVYVYLRLIAHAQLGEVKPFESLFEPKRPLDAGYSRVDELTRALWWRISLAPEPEELLPAGGTFAFELRNGACEHRTASLLVHRYTRGVVFAALSATRKVFHIVPRRHYLAATGLGAYLVRLLFVAEVVSAAPRLASSEHWAASPTP